jgi:hypothetical protein
MLAALAFSQPKVVLVPAEAVKDDGLSVEYREQAIAAGRLDPPTVDTLSRALALRFARQRALASRAPDTFLPPRALNYCIVTDPIGSRPYFEPFVEASALVYACDFARETGGEELGALAIGFAELLGQVGTPGKAMLASLGYLLSLPEAAAETLALELARARRPDAAAFRALGVALPGLRAALLHEGVNLVGAAPETHANIKGTGLYASRAFGPTLGRLLSGFDVEARRVADAYLAHVGRRTGEPEREVAAMLAEDAPRVVLVRGDRVLWHPHRPDETERVLRELGDIGDEIGRSLLRDLRMVDDASRRMRSLLRSPDAMRVPVHSIDEGGGVYLRHEDSIVAYDLDQPGLDASREPGPAFHDLLLAARTAHEWGHVAVENDVVSGAQSGAFDAAKREIAQALRDVAAHVAPELADEIRDELREIASAGEDLGALPLARIEDYSANLLMRHALTPAELEAYVRNNVRPLLRIDAKPLRKLARYAYEAQYLGLGCAPDPWGYFLRISYFAEEMIEGGVTSEARARALFAAVARALGLLHVEPGMLTRSIDGARPPRAVC